MRTCLLRLVAATLVAFAAPALAGPKVPRAKGAPTAKTKKTPKKNSGTPAPPLAEPPDEAPAPAAPTAAAEPPAATADARSNQMRDSILQKLEYDLTYFRQVLDQKKRGSRNSRMSAEEWKKEVRRAQLNVPVLGRLFEQREAYARGVPFGLPRNDETYRVYFNLTVMLNMLQATERADWQSMLTMGNKVVIKDRRNLGLVKGQDQGYYLKLYREFFYLMATAHYRLGNDAEAVKWMARTEGDEDVQALKKALSFQGAQRDPKVERLEALHTRPLVVAPLTALGPQPGLDWVGPGVAEVLANDLVKFSDLVVVERAALLKVMSEVELSQVGVTGDALAKKAGNLLNAGTLLTGSYRKTGGGITLSLKLVDTENGASLAVQEETGPEDDLFPSARKALIALLNQVQWMDDATAQDIVQARAPKTDTVRDLVRARLALANKSGDAKELFEKAAKEDPAYAALFDDLKNEFAGVSATLAVVPFVNAVGDPGDAWMVHGVGQALTADLPKLGFTVVEREELLALLRQKELGQVLSPDKAQWLGQQVNADFIVAGSVLNQRPSLRIDARFVDVRTGVVAETVSAEGKSEALLEVLATLSTEIARKFNEKLTDEQLKQLTGKKMSKEDFEKFVRNQLAKEALARAAQPPPPAPPPSVEARATARSRLPFWAAVGAVGVGAAVSATGFVQSSRSSGAAAYTDGLLRTAVTPGDQARLTTSRDAYSSQSTMWTGVGAAGLAVAAGAAGYLVYDAFFAPEEDLPLAPIIVPGAGSAWVGLSGSF